MALQLLQALIISTWAVLMLKLFKRALKAHQSVAMKKRKAGHAKPEHAAKPMAIRVGASS